jgi:predicted transcriptional regulator
MTLRENFRYIFGIITVAFGSFLIFGGLVNYFDGTETLGSFLALGFFVGILPITAGAWLIYAAKRDSNQRKLKDSEQQILKLAMQSKGRVTATQVATFTSLSLTEADNKLKELQEKGIFIIKISEEGEIVYKLSSSIDGGSGNLIDV